MFTAWGHFAYQHRKVVPAVIVSVVLLCFLIFGTKLDERMSQEGWDDPHSSSTRAAQIEQEVFGRDNSGDIIMLFDAAPSVALNDPGTAQKAKDFLDKIKTEHPEQVDHIDSYFDNRNAQLLSPDQRTAFAAIGLKGDGEDVLKNYRALEGSLTPGDGTLPDGITVSIAGSTAVADALDEGMAGDIRRAEVYALPAVAILLLFVFGSVVAAGMPLVVGILSILGSLGVLSILATQTQVNVFAQSVVTLLGLGLAIDYGLFMVSRFREELSKDVPIPDAVANTTATAGQTVVFSAGMVAVALSGLFIFPQAFLKSVAYGAISAVSLAALLSVTVLPSMFGLLGKNIDKWTVRRTTRSENNLDASFWSRIPAWAMRHSGLVTAGIVAVLVALTIPLMGVKFGGINETYLPPDNKVRQAQAEFDEKFPNFRTDPVKLVVTGTTGNDQLVQVFTQANSVEGLTGRFTAQGATTDGTTVLSAGITDRDDNAKVIKQLREIEAPEGAEVHIGGTPALEVESIEALLSKLPWMFLYIIAATFILMALVFGSMILPAKAIIMTILGLGATLGVLTAMFVDGVGSSMFNFTAGPLMSPVLVLIMSIVYGLSTDYEVFLVSRMVEAKQKGATTDQAIRYGTAHTGSIITAAAVIMIVVCGAFGFSEIVMMKYIAFGMIAALLLDATVIRMLLVPAVMHILREDNWWAPPFVKKASTYLGHTSEPAGAQPTFAEVGAATRGGVGATETSLPRPVTIGGVNTPQVVDSIPENRVIPSAGSIPGVETIPSSVAQAAAAETVVNVRPVASAPPTPQHQQEPVEEPRQKSASAPSNPSVHGQVPESQPDVPAASHTALLPQVPKPGQGPAHDAKATPVAVQKVEEAVGKGLDKAVLLVRQGMKKVQETREEAAKKQQARKEAQEKQQLQEAQSAAVVQDEVQVPVGQSASRIPGPPVPGMQSQPRRQSAPRRQMPTTPPAPTPAAVPRQQAPQPPMTQQKPQQQQQWPSGTQQRPNPVDELSLDDIPLQDLHILAADDAARGGRRASEDTKLIPFTELMERLNTNDPQGRPQQ